MRVLGRALRERGEPIPLPWPEVQIKPAPGDVVLVIAGPGAGKSFYALNWSVDLAEKHRRPVVYISTDTSLSDQAIRASSLLSGTSTADVVLKLEWWADWLHDQDIPIRWSYMSVTAEEIADFMKAEIEFLGEAPAMVVVDVLTDGLTDEENVGEVRRIVRRWKAAGRRFGFVTLILHHIKRGTAANGTSKVTQQDGLYGGEQDATHLLGLWRPGAETLTVATLKNRMGPANADGFMSVDLKADYPHARIVSRGVAW